jgi:hypothetical protein
MQYRWACFKQSTLMEKCCLERGSGETLKMSELNKVIITRLRLTENVTWVARYVILICWVQFTGAWLAILNRVRLCCLSFCLSLYCHYLSAVQINPYPANVEKRWAPNNASKWQVGFNSVFKGLNLILLTWRIWWAPNNASKWQMEFNSVFKGLTLSDQTQVTLRLKVFPV